MADETWQKVRGIFDEALGRRPEERRRFVLEACGEDTTLLSEVESLLSSLGSADSFLETPAVAEVAAVIEVETKKLEAGKCFGHYEIIEQLGAGGMGEVYLAQDKKLDRKVALKILNERFSQHDSNLQRFIREARSASALNHPNILVIHEIGETDGTHYIVSEFVKGKTLREICNEKTLTPVEVLGISIEIANALCTAHEAHLVHRDIKPENIMIRPDGLVKVLDFGLAKLVEQKKASMLGPEESTVRQNQTEKGVILGTVNYMSPEQAKGERVDERTDIFSLGVVIYEMVSRRTPFASASVSETFANLINAQPQPLSRFSSNVPAELQRIVSKMLRKNTDERYQTMKDVLTDLRDVREDLRVGEKVEQAHSLESENATAILQATTHGANLQTAETERGFSGQFRRYRSFAAVALAVLLTGVVGFWFFANRSTNIKRIESIAVLPLENLSGDASQDYFADGMTEALIGNLSKIGSLRVISRRSVMQYKQSVKSIPEIAKELGGVDGIVEGSVQRSGDRILITTRLIDAATDSPIWTKNYERSVSDILKLQSEIAQAVASEIRIQLTPEVQRRFGKTMSIDPRATEAFLLGKHYFNKWSRESERQAVEQFQKAVSIEPEYADAWAGLADAWTVRAMVGDISIPEAEKPTREAAIRALEIDPQNSAAHVSMCFIYNNYDFDWARSENSCKRGIEIDPNNAKAHFAYAYMLARVERWDEMAGQMETAMRLDPAEPWWPSTYGQWLIQARRFEEAERQLKRAIVIDPNWRFAYRALSDLYVELGRFDEALKLAEKWSNNPLSMAYIYARMGNRQKALDFLNRSSDQDRFELALVYTALDDFDNAFKVINQSLDRREGFMFGYANYLALDKLKSDPRWKDVARRMNLPQSH
ncbi:MAG: protein kinase [Pyrinomonadaceae bacterium]